MPDPALGLEAASAAALGALGGIGAWRPRVAAFGTAAVCGAGAIGAIWFLSAGAAPERWAGLPLGLPGLPAGLALDGVSAFFVLPVLLVGGAVAAATTEAACWLGPLLGAALLALLAGDAAVLALGVAALATVGVAAGLSGAGDPAGRRAARRGWGGALASGLLLMAACGLLAGTGGLGFAALRGLPPSGARAATFLVLALLAASVPPPRGAPAAVAAVLEPGWRLVSVYLLVRLLFDLAGPAPPVAWGVPLIGLGAALAGFAARRALGAGDLRTVLERAIASQFGLIVLGLGVALAARGEDLSSLAALALAGALLTSFALAPAAALLLLAAGVAEREAGTRRLARLGGLARGMPRVALAVLGGAMTLAALPPFGGFAGVWLLAQAVFAAARLGFLSLALLAALAAAALAWAVGLLAVAMARLIGVAFLGRPRTPRAAGAQAPPAALHAALLALAALGALIGLFPGAVLALARPALLLAVSDDMAGRAGLFTLAAQRDAAGYAAPAAALLLAGGAGLAVWLGRRRAAWVRRTGPAWDNGFGAPPPWLPFGDPLTQIGPAGFAAPLQPAGGVAARLTARAKRGARRVAQAAENIDERPLRPTLALALGLLVVLLAAFMLAGRM